jgi:hypothetical protein
MHRIVLMKTPQEETAPIQAPQEAIMQKMVVMTQLHQMVVMMIQMMTQSQPL